MKRMLLLAVAGTCLGCVYTPPYNYTAISATDGENGVTVEGRYSCAWIKEHGQDVDNLIARGNANAEAQTYCDRFGKNAEVLSSAITRRCTPDDNWSWADTAPKGVAGTDGVYRLLFACIGADEVRSPDARPPRTEKVPVIRH